MDQQIAKMLNELQLLFRSINQKQLDLPRIVLLGQQSSAKSSVVEHLVGREFLPRGATRRPLILTLVHKEEDEEKGEWGEFAHSAGQRMHDFGLIRREIEAESHDDDKCASHAPIHLTIHSLHVCDFTIIDLPGLTNVAANEKEVRALVIHYISQPNAIIMAVSAGNVDLANSESLKMAKEVDPAGVRTLGVISKLDLLDKGTDALDMLQNRVVALRHGFVGVVCRGEADGREGVTVGDALVAERDFFARHPIYSSGTAHVGTECLAKRLQTLFVQHIQQFLPPMRSQIVATRGATQQEWSLLLMGDEQENNSKDAILRHLTEYDAQVKHLLEGNTVATTTLTGGARISRVFRTTFSRALHQLQPLDALSDAQIKLCLCNAAGVHSKLFLPEACFELLVRQQIGRLLEPSLACLEQVVTELRKIVVDALHETPALCRKFPALSAAIQQVAHDMLRKDATLAQTHIRHIMACEADSINTEHEDFVGVALAMQRLDAGKPQPQPAASSSSPSPIPILKMPISWAQQQSVQKPLTFSSSDVALVRALVASYFGIVKKSVADQVRKAVMHFLVLRLQRRLHNALVLHLYQDNRCQELLALCPKVAQQRADLQALLETFDRALFLIDSASSKQT